MKPAADKKLELVGLAEYCDAPVMEIDDPDRNRPMTCSRLLREESLLSALVAVIGIDAAVDKLGLVKCEWLVLGNRLFTPDPEDGLIANPAAVASWLTLLGMLVATTAPSLLLGRNNAASLSCANPTTVLFGVLFATSM